LNTNTVYFTLSDVLKQVEQTIQNEFSDRLIWIKADIQEIHYSPRGYARLELIEYRKGTSDAEATLRGYLWGNRFIEVSKNFKSHTGIDLKKDLSILFQAKVTYSRKWGLSLSIEHIDPMHTVGQLQLTKDRVITQLKEEGVFDANKRLDFVEVPKKIAVISSKDSRGYEDFYSTMTSHAKGYQFRIDLFEATMAGDMAPASITNQLIKIYQNKEKYDCIVIVRGGGAFMECFNDAKLSRAVARIPIPVISGVGHTANLSIVDMVSYYNAITPTDAAKFILARVDSYILSIEKIVANIINYSKKAFQKEKQDLAWIKKTLNNESISLIKRERSFISNYLKLLKVQIDNLNKKEEFDFINLKSKLKIFSELKVNNEKKSLSSLETQTRLLSPESILKRGYSIIRQNGKVITSSESLEINTKLDIKLFEGELTAKVETIKSIEKRG
jgi:exodeoxyribonuclease VII large subunit